jgi:hypothetical protein
MSEETIGSEPNDAEEPQGSVITILVMGSSDRQVPFTEGMTAGEALRQAELELGRGQTLTRDGQRIKRPDSCKLQPNDCLQLGSQVANG